jgi:hypothetical protein
MEAVIPKKRQKGNAILFFPAAPGYGGLAQYKRLILGGNVAKVTLEQFKFRQAPDAAILHRRFYVRYCFRW